MSTVSISSEWWCVLWGDLSCDLPCCCLKTPFYSSILNSWIRDAIPMMGKKGQLTAGLMMKFLLPEHPLTYCMWIILFHFALICKTVQHKQCMIEWLTTIQPSTCWELGVHLVQWSISPYDPGHLWSGAWKLVCSPVDLGTTCLVNLYKFFSKSCHAVNEPAWVTLIAGKISEWAETKHENK